MLITEPCVISLTWRLEDTLGNLIHELKEPVDFFYGNGDLLPKVEEALAGKEKGFETKLHLEPDLAFGDYDPALVFFADKSKFPEGLETGMQFDGPPPGVDIEGLDPDALYTVTEVYPEHVVLDGNHPLAGIALRLDLKVAAVREATAAEIEARSVSEPLVSVMNSSPNARTLH